MRIAAFVNTFPALSQTFILDQLTGLIARGHDLDIYARTVDHETAAHAGVSEYRLFDRVSSPPALPKNPLKRGLNAVNTIVRSDGAKRKGLLRSLNVARYGREARTLRLLNTASQLRGDPNYDIIHAHFGPNGSLAVRLREIGLLRGKIITTFYGYDASRSLRYASHGYDQLFREGDHFIALTETMRERLIDAGCPRDRIEVQTTGIELSQFAFRERRLDEGEPVRIFTVGRLVDKKGLETSIRAFAMLPEREHLRYDIVGEGPLRGSLEALIRSLGVEKEVRLLGSMPIEEVRAYYEQSHIFMLASQVAEDGDEEGMPNVLKEAQAMGLPVLSTLHAGIPEGVADGESAFLVPERDPAALSERLAYLVSHPDVWPEMGRAGRQFAEDHYDIHQLHDQLVEIYEQFRA